MVKTLSKGGLLPLSPSLYKPLEWRGQRQDNLITTHFFLLYCQNNEKTLPSIKSKSFLCPFETSAAGNTQLFHLYCNKLARLEAVNIFAHVYDYKEKAGAYLSGPHPFLVWRHFNFIIKLITAIIYGFRNKLECFSLNTRLGWKGLQGINTLAYYGNGKLRP